MSAPLIVLKVPGRPPDLHHGKDWNRWQRAARTAERKHIVYALARGELHRVRLAPIDKHNLATNPVKRRLGIVVWWHGPKRDRINLMQDLKADIDALCMAGWLADDSDEWMEIGWPEYEVAFTAQQIAVQYSLYACVPDRQTV